MEIKANITNFAGEDIYDSAVSTIRLCIAFLLVSLKDNAKVIQSFITSNTFIGYLTTLNSMSLQERLNTFILSLGISTQAFERQCNISAGTASRLSVKSYGTTFHKIAQAYPQLNMNWLKTGEGEMLNPAPQEHYKVGIGIGNQRGGNNDFKIEIKEDSAQEGIKEEERLICDLKNEIAHLKEHIKDRDARIAELQASLERERKMNDYLMGQK